MNPDAKEAVRYHVFITAGLLFVAIAVWSGLSIVDGTCREAASASTE